MVKKPTNTRIIEFGEWLCKLVNPGLKNYELEELGETAIQLLGIQFGGDIVPAEFFDPEPAAMVAETDYGLPLEAPEDSPYAWLTICPAEEEAALESWGALPESIYIVDGCLRRVKTSGLPWQRGLLAPTKGTDRITGLAHTDDLAFVADVGRLSHHYSRLSQRISFMSKNIEPTLSFAGGFFDWQAVISRMMFDFFLMGGDPYYGICPHCDKLFTIKRKGRKKYCSDTCKVYAHNERVKAGKYTR